MFFAMIHLVSYYIFMYALLIEDSQSIPFSSELCLEQALTIHAFLTQGVCPYTDLQAGKGPTRCSVLCKGTYTTKMSDPVNSCVGYNISFKLNKMLTTKLADFRCKISNCLLEVIEFECTFNKNYTGVPFNNASSSKEDQINQHDANGRNGSSSIKDDQQDLEVENRSCIDPSTSALISLSCLIGGSLIGIGGLVLLKRLRTYKQKLQLPPVFYQPNYGDSDDLPGREL